MKKLLFPVMFLLLANVVQADEITLNDTIACRLCSQYDDVCQMLLENDSQAEEEMIRKGYCIHIREGEKVYLVEPLWESSINPLGYIKIRRKGQTKVFCTGGNSVKQNKENKNKKSHSNIEKI